MFIYILMNINRVYKYICIVIEIYIVLLKYQIASLEAYKLLVIFKCVYNIIIFIFEITQ